MILLLFKGEAPRNIRFLPNVGSTAIAPNILDPINGIYLTQPNLKSLRNSNLNPSDGFWILGSINIKGLGLEGIFDFEQAILLTGVQDSVYQSIYKTIHGSSFIPPTTAINSASFVSNFSTPINVNNPNSNVVL